MTITAKPSIIREVIRDKPDPVLRSVFDLSEPIPTTLPDGRDLRIVSIEIREGCHDEACLSHLGVNWRLKSGRYSNVLYFYIADLEERSLAQIDDLFSQARSQIGA